MKHNHTVKRILAVCLALLFCLSAANVMFVSAKDSFFNDVMVPGTVNDNRPVTVGKWQYVPVVIKGTTYAVLTAYLDESPALIEIPGTINTYPVLGWGAFVYDAVLKLGQVDFEDMSFFSYLLALDELDERNPFASIQGYELVIPDAFPANIVHVWSDVCGRTDNEIAVWLERFMDLEFVSCAATGFSVNPTNMYLQSEGGVLYTKLMKSLVKYPILKESKQLILPDSVDLYGAIRKTVIISDGAKITKYPGDGILSPFLVYQPNASDAGNALSILQPKTLSAHVSDKMLRKTFKQLRKDNKGAAAKRYYKAYVDLSEGMAYYFAGVTEVCSDCIHAALTEDIGSYCRDLQKIDPEEKGLLYNSLPDVVLCYGHGNNEMSKSLKRLFRMFTLSFYAWHSILLAAGASGK